MTGNKLKFCLIGAGRMGSRWADFINQNNKTELSLIIDSNKKSGSSVAEKYKASFSTQLINNLRGIDAVVVATPHKFLFKYAKEALILGKHVLVEKPGSHNEKQMKELVAIAKKQKVIFMIGFNYRYFDGVAEAKDIVQKGKIGKILLMRIKHGHAGRVGYEKEWRMNKKEAGGGVLMDQGVHAIDLANWFLSSEMSSVKSFKSNNFWAAEVEDNAFLLLKNKDKQIASIHVSITEWKPTFMMEIIGTKGYCVVSGLGKKYDNGEKLFVGFLKRDHTVLEKTKKYNVKPFDSVRKELECFVNSIKKRKNLGPNGVDGIKVLKIVKKAYKNND